MSAPEGSAEGDADAAASWRQQPVTESAAEGAVCTEQNPASIVSPRRVLPWPSGVSRLTSPPGGQRADEAAAPILPVLPWPSGVSRPTSPLGVVIETIQLATSAKLVETDAMDTTIQFATGTANATGAAIQSSFVSSFQFVSSFVSSQIAFRSTIRYHWMCIPLILLRFEQFENESSEYHWMCIPLIFLAI